MAGGCVSNSVCKRAPGEVGLDCFDDDGNNDMAQDLNEKKRGSVNDTYEC